MVKDKGESMSRQRSIVRGGWLFAGHEWLHGGAVVLEGERIIEVGHWQEIARSYPGVPVYGTQHHMVIPGLINAHHHSGGIPQSLHGVKDDTLEPWLLSTLGMRPEDAYLASALSAARLLKSGVTSVVDMTVVGSEKEAREDTEARLRAYRDAGLAAAVAPGMLQKSFLVSGDGEDERFLASLPAALKRRVREQIPLAAGMSADEYLQCISSLADQWNGAELQQVWFGPPGPQWSEPELLKRIVSTAEQHTLRIQTHALESFHEKLEGLRSHGIGTVEWLHSLGVLSPRLTLAHGVWLTEREIQLLAKTGTAVSHNPSSNLRLRAGTAPLNALRGAGVPLALGLDANGINDDDDMFTEMRMALRLHRSPGMSADTPEPTDIFRMATEGGAGLLGAEEYLGRLAEGYRGDVVLLDTRRMFRPWYEEHADPLTLLLTRARAEDVDSVWVAGRPAVRGGTVLGIDEAQCAEALAEQLRETPTPDRLRGVIDELKPYLREWYRRWEHPTLEPYAAFNSRT